MNTRILKRREAGLAGILLSLLISLLPAGAAQAGAPDLLPPCGQPPAAGNWTINASCDLTSLVIAPQNITITNNATVAVPGGRWLNVDFVNRYLRIMPGSKLLIQPGARVLLVSAWPHVPEQHRRDVWLLPQAGGRWGDEVVQRDLRVLSCQHHQGAATSARHARGGRGHGDAGRHQPQRLHRQHQLHATTLTPLRCAVVPWRWRRSTSRWGG